MKDMKVNRKLNRKTRILEIHRALTAREKNLKFRESLKADYNKHMDKRAEECKRMERDNKIRYDHIQHDLREIYDINSLMEKVVKDCVLNDDYILDDDYRGGVVYVLKRRLKVFDKYLSECKSVIKESKSVTHLSAQVASRDETIADLKVSHKTEIAKMQANIDLLLDQKAMYQERLINNKR